MRCKVAWLMAITRGQGRARERGLESSSLVGPLTLCARPNNARPAP